MRVVKTIWDWLVPIIIGLLLAGILRLFIMPVKVDGPSMAPNLVNNERVFALRKAQIRRGSVIVFNAAGVDPTVTKKTVYVKRVIGLPGDTVEAKNNQIYVNNKPIKQDYISLDEQTTGTGSWTFQQLAQVHDWQNYVNVTKVPNGEYFVLGDHRSVSNDSRYFGFVPQAKIQGVVKVPFWSGTDTTRKNINQQWQDFW